MKMLKYLFFLIGFVPLTAKAQIFVDAGNSSATNKDGSTWAKAYDSLNLAIAGATAGNYIFVKGGGTFKPTAGTLRSKSFTIDKAIHIYGGFVGEETGTSQEILAARPKNFVKATLSGDIKTTGTDSDNCYHVVHITAAGATLDGFIITDGNANGSGSNNSGGGVYMRANATLRHLEIHNNKAGSGGGGGAHMNAGTLSHSVLHNNTTTSAGGGINLSGAGKVINCVLYSNSCGSSIGGGIHINSNAEALVLNNTLYGNSSPGWRGGGISLNSSVGPSTRIVNNIIYGNTASNAGNNVFTNNSTEVTFTHNLVEGADAAAAITGDPNRIRNTPHCVFTTTSPFASTTSTDTDFLRHGALSLAIDAGDNQALPADVTKDLIGSPRQTNIVDIGAYEKPLPQIHYVNADATGSKDGTTWTNAYDSLNLAIAGAAPGDYIFVKGGGLFKPAPLGGGQNSSGRRKPFLIDTVLYIYGGFLGTERGTPKEIIAARPANFVKDTLSGDIGTLGTNLDNTYQLVVVTGTGAVLDGFVIKGGIATDSGGKDKGGGVYMTGNSTLRNLVIHDNRASKGGGVYLSDGRLTHSLIYDNDVITTTGAGGVSMEGGTIANCLIHSNNTIGGGGGLRVEGGTVVNNSIHNNQSSNLGGGIHLPSGSTAEIVNNIIYGNTGNNGNEVNNAEATATFENNLVKGADESAAITGTAFNSTPNCIFTTTDPFASTTKTANNFLHLSATSPALNGGDNSHVDWDTDFGGNARIADAAVDMGAYEGSYRGKLIYVDAGVDKEGPTPINGESWDGAFDSLQHALAAARASDTILVKGGGLFKSRPNSVSILDRTKFFTIDKAIALYGGLFGNETGSGKEIVAARPKDFVWDTLSANIGDLDVNTDNSHHGLFVSADGAYVDGFAITGGEAHHANSSYNRGGGVYMTGNSILTNLLVFGNQAEEGGGTYITAGTVMNSVIRNNNSTSYGGGIRCFNSSQYVGCVIYGNNTPESAISMTNDSKMINSTIYGNHRRIYMDGGVIWANNIIYNNTVIQASSGGSGGTGKAFNNLFDRDISDKTPSPNVGNTFTPINPFVSTTEGDADFLRIFPGFLGSNAGDNSFVPDFYTHDISGNPRIQGGVVDIGAYETTPSNSVYVDAEATGSKDGTTWANAYDELHLAIEGATAGDYIFVKGGGTFKATTGTSRSKSFAVDKVLYIYGGFLGTEAGTAKEIIAKRPKNFVKPILSGDIGTAGTRTDNRWIFRQMGSFWMVL